MINSASALLEGVKVVELGQSVAGPWAGTIMADLGATVIKIEAPNGDSARSWGPPFIRGDSAVYQFMNRNKLGMVLDLKNINDRGVFDRLISEADVFVHNMRPGSVEKLGIDAMTLRTAKPSLIYGDMTAFGSNGPMAGRPGYEMALQAYGGIMSITGTEEGGPVRAGPSLNDFGTGMWTAIGVLAALVRRGISGEGCVIETSLLETAVNWVGLQMTNFTLDGKVPARMGAGHALVCPYGAYKASDHPIIIATGSDALFGRLAEALGQPEWAADPEYKTMEERLARREKVDAMVQAEVIKNSRGYWMDYLTAHGVPCTPIQDLADLVDDPQISALGLMTAPLDCKVPLVGLPLSVNGVRPPISTSATTLASGRETARSAASVPEGNNLFEALFRGGPTKYDTD